MSDKYAFQGETLTYLTTPPRPPKHRVLTVSPTGTGKSYMMNKLQSMLGFSKTLILLPTPELMPDFIEKNGIKVPERKDDMVELGNQFNIFSTLDLRNKMGRGMDFSHIENIIIDEAHHDIAATYDIIYTGLPENVRRYGFTATPYCGTPRATYKFRNGWDEIYYAIMLSDALERGVITYPQIIVEPLVNDDIMELQGGEFVIRQVESEFQNKIEHALHITKDMGWWNSKGWPTKTTIIGVPSSKCFESIQEYGCQLGLQLSFITQETSFKERKAIYTAFKARKTSIVHINVVSEGKDLPVRNYLDMRPLVSPRLFFQIFGRCTRPLGKGETLDDLGVYLCTNRNIERHGYLFDNTLPYEQVKKAVAAFPEMSQRTGVRAFGIESLGRIKPTTVKLVNGMNVTIYNVSQLANGKKESFLCLLHPCKADPVWFKQTAGVVRDGVVQRMAYDRWEYIQPPTELKGYRSSAPSILTEKQLNMWKKHAESRGLDPEQKIDRKKFSLLPVLINSGVSLC